MKDKIEYSNKKFKGGYIGMNEEAAKQLHIPFKHKHPEHTIEIYHKLPHDVRYTTIRHEEAEEYFVKNLHKNRQQSHAMALRFENRKVPFPKTNIKYNLKKMGFLPKK